MTKRAGLMIYGDSYVAAARGVRPGYARVAGLLLGRLPVLVGMSGSGFVHSSGGPRYPDGLPHVAEHRPRLLLLQATGNDAVADLAEVEAATGRFLAVVAATSPQTRTLVFGPFWAKTGSEHLPELADHTAKACARMGVPYLGGFGWVLPRHIGPDGAHPTWAGHVALGRRVAAAVRTS